MVGLSFGPDGGAVGGVWGRVLLSTERTRQGERVDSELRLAPAEAAIVQS